MELDHLIRDRHVTGIFQEGIIFERNAYYTKFFMNCLKKLTKGWVNIASNQGLFQRLRSAVIKVEP